jgi:hypothetical protein
MQHVIFLKKFVSFFKIVSLYRDVRKNYRRNKEVTRYSVYLFVGMLIKWYSIHLFVGMLIKWYSIHLFVGMLIN